MDTYHPTEMSETAVLPSEVLLKIKTGASTVWRRMPAHLIATLSNNRVPNYAVFSEMQERLSESVETIDVLVNSTKAIRQFDETAYASYMDLRSHRHVNTYREKTLLPGDELSDKLGTPPGWHLDKYKFLPMLQYAQDNWPDMKWYVYIEDDTFIFWGNLLRWLSKLPPDDAAVYFGAVAGEEKRTYFAQGGSGIVFKQSMMRSVFAGSNIPSLNTHGNYTASACCGDIALGHVLRGYGWSVSEQSTFSFRPEPTWKTSFNEEFWCEPVFTMHHLHQRDISQFAELERQFELKPPEEMTILFHHIFRSFILPYLINDTISSWDNLVSTYRLTEHATKIPEAEKKTSESTILELGFISPGGCKDACSALNSCYSWKYETATKTCFLDNGIKLGREVDSVPTQAPNSEIVSGWMLERLETILLTQDCKKL